MAAILFATAAQAEGPPDGQGGPPPAITAQINLGRAGLLDALNNDSHFSFAQGRIGAARARIGAIDAGGPAGGYQDDTVDFGTPFNLVHLLPGGRSKLTFGVGILKTNASPNSVESDGLIGKVSLSYAFFPDPGTIYQAQLYVDRSDIDLINSGTVTTNRAGIRVTFSDETAETYDLATGADGV